MNTREAIETCEAKREATGLVEACAAAWQELGNEWWDARPELMRERFFDAFSAGYAAASRWHRISTDDDLPKEEGKKYLVALWNFRVNKPDYGLRMFRDGYFEGAEYTHIRVVAWQEVAPYTGEDAEERQDES